MNMTGDLLMFLPMLALLLHLGLIGFGIFIVLAFLKQGKERNAFLKEIADELRQNRK